MTGGKSTAAAGGLIMRGARTTRRETGRARWGAGTGGRKRETVRQGDGRA